MPRPDPPPDIVVDLSKTCGSCQRKVLYGYRILCCLDAQLRPMITSGCDDWLELETKRHGGRT